MKMNGMKRKKQTSCTDYRIQQGRGKKTTTKLCMLNKARIVEEYFSFWPSILRIFLFGSVQPKSLSKTEINKF